MGIFTNWIFWIVLSTILFIFALIGFLTDKKKGKDKTDGNLVSDNPSSNNSTEVLNSNANSFNLESPVQEEVKGISEPTSSGESEPTMSVSNDILDVSGSLSLGEVSSLNGNQDNPSFTNGSLGENVQMSEGNPLGGDDSAIRNQVNLNPVPSSEVSSQPNDQVNGVSSTSGVTNDVNNSVYNGQTANSSLNGNVQGVNEMTSPGVAMESQNTVNSEVSVNNVSNQPTVSPESISGVVNNSTGNTEQVYDTWS